MSEREIGKGETPFWVVRVLFMLSQRFCILKFVNGIIYKSCCVYNLIFRHNNNVKQRNDNTPFRLPQARTCPQTAGSRNSYSTDILFTYHSQPALNPYNTLSLKVHIYSHYYSIQGRKRLASYWVLASTLSQITKGVKNGDDGGLGQEIKVSHSWLEFSMKRMKGHTWLLMAPFSTFPWEIDSLEPFPFPNPICRCSQYRYWQRDVGHPEGTSIGSVFEHCWDLDVAPLS